MIMIDAGHGGQDRGCAISSGLGSIDEADYALSLARRLYGLTLGISGGCGLIRHADETIRLYERGMIAARNGASLLVSLHVDSRPEALRGLSCWHLPTCCHTAALAHRVYELAPDKLRLPRGPGRARPVVSAGAEEWQQRGRAVLTAYATHGIDALLVEVGDCVGDREALLEIATQQQICAAIARALQEIT